MPKIPTGAAIGADGANSAQKNRLREAQIPIQIQGPEQIEFPRSDGSKVARFTGPLAQAAALSRMKNEIAG